MRKGLILLPTLLWACSIAPAKPVVHGETPGHECKAQDTDQFIGQSKSNAIEKQIKTVSNAAILRWAPPGVMLTMDYRSDRVTAWLDPAGRITKVRCG